MKWVFLALSLVCVAPMPRANAAEADDSDLVILSVEPRSAEVKPVLSSLPATGGKADLVSRTVADPIPDPPADPSPKPGMATGRS